MNHVVLVGRLTKDPELRYIPGTGTAVASFSISATIFFSKISINGNTDFIPVEVMGKPAEFCANYISKGRLVAIQGSIRVDNYQTQSGEKRTFTKVSARNIQALDSNKNRSDSPYPNQNQNQGFEPSFEPSFEPAGLDPQGFQAIDDDDIPF